MTAWMTFKINICLLVVYKSKPSITTLFKERTSTLTKTFISMAFKYYPNCFSKLLIRFFSILAELFH